MKRSLKKIFRGSGLSRSTVGNITEKVVEEFHKWKRRDLSGLSVLYPVMDGIMLGVRGGTKERRPCLRPRPFVYARICKPRPLFERLLRIFS